MNTNPVSVVFIFATGGQRQPADSMAGQQVQADMAPNHSVRDRKNLGIAVRIHNMSDQIPGSVRIRTDEGNERRYDAIQKAADYYDRNRSDAVAFACDDLPELVESAREVLNRDDLTEQQKREIAETLSSRAVSFGIETEVSVSTNGTEQ